MSELLKEKFFCSAERPDYCLHTVNLCCLHCEYSDECYENAKRNAGSKKLQIVPCKEEQFDDDEYCSFQI